LKFHAEDVAFKSVWCRRGFLMARTYEPDSTRFYLILAVVLAFLSVWHIYDGWVPQTRWLERYPDFPETWYDLGLYEFYAYNRWTGILLGVGALVCALISARSHWGAGKNDALLSELTQLRRQRRK